jgi:hypothetical protein
MKEELSVLSRLQNVRIGVLFVVYIPVSLMNTLQTFRNLRSAKTMMGNAVNDQRSINPLLILTIRPTNSNEPPIYRLANDILEHVFLSNATVLNNHSYERVTSWRLPKFARGGDLLPWDMGLYHHLSFTFFKMD